MQIVKTIFPYGCVNVKEILFVCKKNEERFYAVDKYGFWKINEEDYYNLLDRGIENYETK